MTAPCSLVVMPLYEWLFLIGDTKIGHVTDMVIWNACYFGYYCFSISFVAKSIEVVSSLVVSSTMVVIFVVVKTKLYLNQNFPALLK